MRNGYSIASNFDQYFDIIFASYSELLTEAYKIRYNVYSKELGWEPSNEQEIESDEYDASAYHCLIKHKRTGVFAGCIRLIIPNEKSPHEKLPFEQHCLSSIRADKHAVLDLPRGSFGEISRLAVLNSFRRRDKEQNKPFILKELNPNTMYSEEERRNFPNIAIGLYLSGLALASLCNHKGIFVMMEPKLNRRLQRFGLPFEQIGEEMDYHGTRAMFFLAANSFSAQLDPQIYALYQLIFLKLEQQIPLKRYGKNTPFLIPNLA